MHITKTTIDNQVIITISPIADPRGDVVQIYEKEAFFKININENFNQDFITNSLGEKTLRGLHFQTEPHLQTKLVRCQRGSVLDVTVDLRKRSPTYLQVFSVNLKEDDWTWLYIPPGVAHGFITLANNTQVNYKISGKYSPKHATGINWGDPTFNIDWKVNPLNVVLSEKDKNLPNFEHSRMYFP